ncbi:hypothetical protein RJ639_033182 [Escallonia herrerae]|uniref:Xylanase inhibitor N-terminal domain-containing protein n=1 Tax=Escallonia herrerae TaxID=1293975 RepID=A0AA89BA12_9ASTE|nr:hypothetical protein RJ639_033182 [Escallonia herrerae]
MSKESVIVDRVQICDTCGTEKHAWWLHERLDEVCEALRLSRGYPNLKVALANNCQDIERKKKELDIKGQDKMEKVSLHATKTDCATRSLERSIARLSFLRAATMDETPEGIRGAMLAGTDGASSSGNYATEKLTFITTEVGSTASNIRFGCGRVIQEPDPHLSGVMGFGYAETSLAKQLANKFSYCIGNIHNPDYSYNRLILGDGAIIRGDSTPLEVIITRVAPQSPVHAHHNSTMD